MSRRIAFETDKCLSKCSMVKFATFESTVNQIYKYLGKPKDQFNALQQTGVSFLGGYIAGVGCAVVSHPADVMVSKLNSDRQRMLSKPQTRYCTDYLALSWRKCWKSNGEHSRASISDSILISAKSRIYGKIGFSGLWNGYVYQSGHIRLNADLHPDFQSELQ